MRVVKCKPGCYAEILDISEGLDGIAENLGVNKDDLMVDYCFDDIAVLVRLKDGLSKEVNRTVEGILKYGPFVVCAYHIEDPYEIIGLNDQRADKYKQLLYSVDAEAWYTAVKQSCPDESPNYPQYKHITLWLEKRTVL